MSESALYEINGREFRQLLDAAQPLVVQFGTPNCAPCRALEPVLARLAAKYQGQINIVYLDVEKHSDLGRRYNIWAAPTLISFRHGERQRLKARDLKTLDEAMHALVTKSQAAQAASDATAHNNAPQTPPGLLPLAHLHPRLVPFGRDIDHVGISAAFTEGHFALQGLVYRVGANDAAGLRIGGGHILSNRHVFEQMGGASKGPAWAGRLTLPKRPELVGRAVPQGLPGGQFVMPFHIGRYEDWALLEGAAHSVVVKPVFRSAETLRQGETCWIVGGTDGEHDLITVGQLKYVKGVNGMLRDCDVRPGMSGAAVADASGQVVGIFSTQFSWPGRRAMFVTIDAIAQGIDTLRALDASLPQIDVESTGSPVDSTLNGVP